MRVRDILLTYLGLGGSQVPNNTLVMGEFLQKSMGAMELLFFFLKSVML